MNHYQDTRDSRIKRIGEWYHARFSCKGQRVQKALNTKNFAVAQKLAEDIEKAILLGEDWRREKEIFEDAWEEFIEAKATGKVRGIAKVRERTIKEYIHFGERWYKPFFGSIRVDQITGDTWVEYMAHVKEKSKSGDSTKFLNHWKYLSGFFSWCLAVGYIIRAPEIYNPDAEYDEDDGVGKSYTDEQLMQFRDGKDGVPAPEQAVRLWIIMAQYMGMRSSEITQLAKDRIDWGSGCIRLKKLDTKTGQSRVVPIHSEVIEALKKQCADHPKSPYVFPNAWDEKRPMDKGGFKKPWTKLRQALGIDGRFHDFRASYATRAFSNSALNPVVVCSALGMSMKVAMKHYIRFDEKHLNAVAANFRLGTGRESVG